MQWAARLVREMEMRVHMKEVLVLQSFDTSVSQLSCPLGEPRASPDELMTGCTMTLSANQSELGSTCFDSIKMVKVVAYKAKYKEQY